MTKKRRSLTRETQLKRLSALLMDYATRFDDEDDLLNTKFRLKLRCWNLISGANKMPKVHWSIGLNESDGVGVCGRTGPRSLDETKVTCKQCLITLADLDAATEAVSKRPVKTKSAFGKTATNKSG
jgi:hypothetical protein